VLSLSAISLLSSFKTNEACSYAGSNIDYVKTQTALAIEGNDLNKTKFLTYRAIKAIYKLRKQLNECGCEQAILNIEESQFHLKKATKATSLQGAKALLMEAYNNTLVSLAATEKHHLHQKTGVGEALAMNTIENPKSPNFSAIHLAKNDLHVLIDDSLIPYEKSLQRVVDSVDCKDAAAFAQRIFKICEQELLQQNLSEGKKYYNLKTQEITANALKKLGDCAIPYSK
jgi:hypothetical protein